MRFSRKCQAVISVFLIIVMLPLLGLAVVLVDGSRVRGAEMMVQEASDLAALSTLANYNKNLKNDYGLFALKDEDKAEAIFEAYLKNSLKAATGGDDTYSDQMYNAVKETIFGEGSKVTKFTDLFQYNLGSSKVETLFPLDQKDVLQTQMIEYTKYRGIYLLADRLSLLAKLSDVKQQYEDTKKSTELMEKKLDIDEESEEKVEAKVQELNLEITALYDAVESLNEEAFISNFKSQIRQVLDAANRKYDENINSETWSPESSVATNLLGTTLVSYMQTACKDMDSRGDAAKKAFDKIDINEVNSLITNTKNQIEKLEKFKNEQVNESTASVKEEMIKDIDKTIAKYESYVAELTELQKYFLTDTPSSAYFQDKKNFSIAVTMGGNTASAVKHSLIDEMNSPEVIKSEGRTGLKWDKLEEVSENSRYIWRTQGRYNNSTDEATNNYFGSRSGVDKSCVTYAQKCKEVIQHIAPITGTAKDNKEKEDDRDKAKQAAEKANEKQDSYGTKSIPDSELAALPSKGTQENNADKSKYTTDVDKMTDDTDKILKGGNNFFSNLANATRDEALTFAYIFGMFKTRMSDGNKFNSSSKPDTSKNYVVAWRYEHDDGEHDLRERPKKDLDTMLDAEIEYIFGGHKSDQANCAAIYATIFSIRAANNIVAVYCNSDAKNQCYKLGAATAAAVSAATLGVVTLSPTIYQWIYITAWALAETCMEMDFLIDKGYRIPLVKTSKNLLTSSFFDLFTPSESRLEESVKNSFISVCYEDYLILLMLVLTNSDTRVRRSADLIQLNIRKRHDADFLMSKSPTYIKANTDVSIDYLFHQISQFSEFYPGKGIKFSNTIYQGY